MTIVWVFCLALGLLYGSFDGHCLTIEPTGTPEIRPELLSFQGREIEAARVQIDLGITDDLLYLWSGFVCPAQEPGSSCLSSSPSCTCDYTAECGTLPACCQSGNLFHLTCDTFSSDAFQIISPSSTMPVLLGSSPLYFRYHPSTASRCQGWGLLIRPPPTDVVGSDRLNVALHAYGVYVSYTHPRPEEDPNAHFQYFSSVSNPLSSSKSIVFCPMTSALPNPQINQFSLWIPSHVNTNTVFISLLSLSTIPEGVLEVSALFSFYETNDISLQTLVDFPSPPSDPVSILNGQTFSGFLQQGQFFFISYEHQEPECRNVIIDLHLGGFGDGDLYSTLGPEINYFNTMWFSYQIGADQVTLNLCPGEVISVLLDMFYGPYLFFLTVLIDPVVEALSIYDDLNPLVVVPNTVKASRLVCSDALIPTPFYSANLFAFYCEDWLTAAIDDPFRNNCQQYFPLAPLRDTTVMWPPPSRNYMSDSTLQSLIPEQLASNFDFSPVRGSYFAAVVVKHRFSKDGQVATSTFFEWDQLQTCQIEFLATLVTPSGDRVRGLTPTLQPVLEQILCEPENVQTALQEINSLSRFFGSDLFFEETSYPEQQTMLLQQVLIALTSQVSSCSWIISELFLKEQQLAVGLVKPPVNCLLDDPCCPDAPQSIRYFFSFCPSSIDWKFASQSSVLFPVVAEYCPNGECLAALLEELADGRFRIEASQAGQSPGICSFTEESVTVQQKQIADYYASCKARYIGRIDDGLPCQLDSDCLVGRCRPISTDALNQYSFRSATRRIYKICQANSRELGELIFNCLLDEMPYTVKAYLEGILQQDSNTKELSFREGARLLFSRPGCSSNSSLSVLGHRRPLLTLYGDFWNPFSTCPQPIGCLDEYCSLPYICRSPWEVSLHSLGPYEGPPMGQSECLSAMQCNVATSGTGVHVCLSDECTAECQSVVGSATFCGYCFDTGCLQLVDIDGIPQTCDTGPLEACFFPDLHLLLNEPCAGRGSCTIADDSPSSSLADILSQNECSSHQGMCLSSPERSLIFPGGGCLGSILYDSFYSCTDGSRATEAGCLYVDQFGNPIPGYAVPAECEGQLDPHAPPGSGRYLHWIDPIKTPEACLHDERLFTCQLPVNASTPDASAPNQNNRSICEIRGGVFSVPFLWEAPAFVPGVPVLIPGGASSTFPVQAIPMNSWVDEGVFNFEAFASFLTNTANARASQTNSLVAICSYSNALAVSISATACDCQFGGMTTNVSAEELGCAELSVPNSGELPPVQFLGTQIVCDTSQIDDNVSYPTELDMPPVALAMLPESHFTTPSKCVSLSGWLYSNSRMIKDRTRIRLTSFFIARQDPQLPPLASFSDNMAVNGRIVSDGVRFSSDERLGLRKASLCIRPRRDFLQFLHEQLSNSSLYPHVDFGFLDGWVVRTLSPSPNDVYVTYMSPDGSFYLAASPGSLVIRPLDDIVQVCRVFDEISFNSLSSNIFTLVLIGEDPQAKNNGFSTLETVWLYLTAAFYLVPVIFVYFPSVFYMVSNGISLLKASHVAASFLSLCLVFRAALLFGLADAAITESSVTEFALSDIAIWCEFAALSVLTLTITLSWLRSRSLRAATPFEESRMLIVGFVVFIGALLALFVAFVIAYAVIGSASSGISSPTTRCAGRLPADDIFWTAQRIIRFTYEVVVVFCCLLLGIWLAACGSLLFSHGSSTRKMAVVSSMLCFAVLSHGIISLILIGTEYNNFAFGLTMLYATELIPLFLFILLVLWDSFRNSATSILTRASSPTSSK